MKQAVELSEDSAGFVESVEESKAEDSKLGWAGQPYDVFDQHLASSLIGQEGEAKAGIGGG